MICMVDVLAEGMDEGRKKTHTHTHKVNRQTLRHSRVSAETNNWKSKEINAFTQ